MRPTRSRRLDSSAATAFVPVLGAFALCVGALALVWLPLRGVLPIGLPALVAGYAALGLLLFVRPFQEVVLSRLLGARTPTPDEAARLGPAWRVVTQRMGVPTSRYVVRVLDADEVNAFASGGHLVIVTSYAVDALPDAELRGVLAHELSHHLGMHTVSLTMGHWFLLPVVVLARLGIWLQRVADAATEAFASRSPLFTLLGRIVTWTLWVVALVLSFAVVLTHAATNVFGRATEFKADTFTVRSGFGPALASALRRFVAEGSGGRPAGWRERLLASHPPARTRVARIEAQLRHPRTPRR
jgi:Zn-dependent protease with chaperone function